jgi:hypothetical protein
MIRKILVACLLTLSAGTTLGESGFLTDYSQLKPQESEEGTDLVYVSADGMERLPGYNAVMVDQPEIHFSADSEYRGMKPEDVQAIASMMRETLNERLTAGGYSVVEQAGANVLFVRLALTELYLKKKKRKLLQYTPVGAVVKAGGDALKGTLDKVDIIEMTLEAELADSQSGDVLGALVVERGARKAKGQKEVRIDMDEFRATIDEYSSRLACRLDNAKLPEAQWIDCTDPQAREAREGAGP